MDGVEEHELVGGDGEHRAGGRPLPAWLRRTAGEHRWPVAIAIVATIALQLLTPANLAFDPKWVLPAIEFALLVGLIVADPYRINRESTALRAASLVLVGVASLAIVWSTGRLVAALVSGGAKAGPVLIGGATIWLTNVIVFALWFWELDRGGPAARANARRLHPDFLFPQMSVPKLASRDWEPEFTDYLYVAFTNATAFSPTDTLPLTRLAKLAMAIEAAVSFTVVILVVARAVNTLGQ